MDLCPELGEYKSVTSEVINLKIKSTRLQSSNQQNMAHYVTYNRLMDYWNIVDKQYKCMASNMRPGETIIRDRLHRFVYALS